MSGGKWPMAKVCHLTFAICLLPLAMSFGDFNSDAKGTTAAKFLALGVDARAEAMGQAYSAVADEASALYWNPGAMTRILQKIGIGDSDACALCRL
jgi:long-subunit fatty acid transport protein